MDQVGGVGRDALEQPSWAHEVTGHTFDLPFGSLPGRLNRGHARRGAVGRRRGAAEPAPAPRKQRVGAATQRIEMYSHPSDPGPVAIDEYHAQNADTLNPAVNRARRKDAWPGGVGALA